MEYKTRRPNRFGTLALLGVILGVGTLFAGCGKPDETGKKPATQIGTKVPVNAAPEQKSPDKPASDPRAQTPESGERPESPVDRIVKVDNFFRWFEIRTKYRETGEQNVDVEAALSKKEQELLEKQPAQKISDSLEFVAFDWKVKSVNPDDAKSVTFQASWLFHTKGSIILEPDHVVSLILRGRPDKSHLNYLPRERDRKNGYFEFSYDLNPSIDTWEKGEYHLVSYRAYRPLPNIPYRIQTFFSERKKKEDGTTEGLGGYGDRIVPGWYVDLGE